MKKLILIICLLSLIFISVPQPALASFTESLDPYNFTGIEYILPLFLINLIIEVPLFLLFFRKEKNKKKALIMIIIINFFTFYLLYIHRTIQYIEYNLLVGGTFFSKLIITTIDEILIILSEAIVIKLTLKETKFNKILLFSFVANFLSMDLGFTILDIVVKNFWGIYHFGFPFRYPIILLFL